MADPRAFGYIFGSPDQGHRFFGIKTDKHANLVCVSSRIIILHVTHLQPSNLGRRCHEGLISGCLRFKEKRC